VPRAAKMEAMRGMNVPALHEVTVPPDRQGRWFLLRMLVVAVALAAVGVAIAKLAAW